MYDNPRQLKATFVSVIEHDIDPVQAEFVIGSPLNNAMGLLLSPLGD